MLFAETLKFESCQFYGKIIFKIYFQIYILGFAERSSALKLNTNILSSKPAGLN